MAIEIEKKFRLDEAEFERLSKDLNDKGDLVSNREFEKNTLYSNDELWAESALVRIRVTDTYSALTYKKKQVASDGLKKHIEYESKIEDSEETSQILVALGLKPVIEYEKYRTTYSFQGAEIVLDELPFGLFLEVEGDEAAIETVEESLELSSLTLEANTYPSLVGESSPDNDGVFRSVFPGKI